MAELVEYTSQTLVGYSERTAGDSIIIEAVIEIEALMDDDSVANFVIVGESHEPVAMESAPALSSLRNEDI